MKAIILLASACVLSLNMAAIRPNFIHNDDEYCAKKKEGKVYVMHEGKQLTSSVTLDNGVQIKTDGTVIKKDGSRMMLKDGQCLNSDGTMDKRDMKKSDKEDKDDNEAIKRVSRYFSRAQLSQPLFYR